jgi:hypothetical protein
MKTIAKLLCLLGVLSLTACGASENHPHDEGRAAHSHDILEAHSHEAHGHGGGDHVHEATETEAFYGDEADVAGGTSESGAAADKATGDAESGGLHTHGDGEPHTHDH